MDLNVKRKTALTLLCGLLGCFCFGAGDWLMLYGDTVHKGSILWLTEGAAAIPAWRNTLAMALSFPGILFYGVALHLFYIMILYGFGWMCGNGYEAAALPVSEAVIMNTVDLTGVAETCRE